MRYLIVAVVLALAALPGWPAAAVPPSCAEFDGVVEADHICHVHATNATYTLDLTFPVDYPDQQALNDYITQNRDGFVNVAQTAGARDQLYELEATAEQHSSGEPPRTRSVVLKFFEELGGAHPSNWYKSFNYNLDTKQPITFDNLFAPGTTPLDSIFPLVQRDLERQNLLAAAILPSIGLDPSHYQNFAITDDQLIFYFAPGEMLPPFVGLVQARVPRDAIPPLAI